MDRKDQVPLLVASRPLPSYHAIMDPEILVQSTKQVSLRLRVVLNGIVPPMPNLDWIRTGALWYVSVPSDQIGRLASHPTVQRITLA